MCGYPRLRFRVNSSMQCQELKLQASASRAASSGSSAEAFGGVAEAVLLRRRYAVMKARHAPAADESATRGVSRASAHSS